MSKQCDNKTRNLSIYLLKQNYTYENSLKEDHSLESAITATNLPEGAKLFIMDSAAKDPWWKEYWGISKELKQVLKGAIVFLPVNDRCFALTFGHTYHNLKEESYEYDFGLKVSLNMLDPDKIKSADTLKPDSAKRQRVQSPTLDTAAFFDIDDYQTILKNLAGKLKDKYCKKYNKLLTSVTGTNSLRVTSSSSPQGLNVLCSDLLNIYNNNDYKNSFPNALSIEPIKDPVLINKLDINLLEAFNTEKRELVLAIPKILDHAEHLKINFTGARPSKNKHDDVFIKFYRDYLKEKNIQNVSVDLLKKHYLNLVDDNNNQKEAFKIYDCFLYDCICESSSYHLNEGQWYKISDDYIRYLKAQLDPLFMPDSLLTPYNDIEEKDYNQRIAKENSIECLDRENVAPKGQSAIEPCDLIRLEGNKIHMYHIKRSTRSGSLSHLFNQGANAIRLLKTTPESKSKLKCQIQNNSLKDAIDKHDSVFSVTYGIITVKPEDLKSDALPLFSKISLCRALRDMLSMGTLCNIVLIKDVTDPKGIKGVPSQ